MVQWYFMTHCHFGHSLPQLRSLPLAFAEARLQVIQLTLHLLLFVLHVLFGASEGSQVSAQICCLLLQSLLTFLQSSSDLHGETEILVAALVPIKTAKIVFCGLFRVRGTLFLEKKMP